MNWTTLAWSVIAIVAIFVMARGCGGMGRMGGGCGMPRRQPNRETPLKKEKAGD